MELRGGVGEPPRAVLERAMRFLGLALPIAADAAADESAWRAILDPPRERAGPRPPGGLPPMPAPFEAALRAFYAPSLAELVHSLREEPDAAEWRAWAQPEWSVDGRGGTDSGVQNEDWNKAW